MIDSDQIEDITAADVRSSDDEKVGSVGQVFLDGQTGRPEWAAVRTGLFGTKEAFVPLRNAEWDGRVVRIAYDKERVRNAPHVEPDDRGLDPNQQVELYTYYGFTEADAASARSAGTRSGQTLGGASSGQRQSSDTPDISSDAAGTPDRVDASSHDPIASPTSSVRAEDLGAQSTGSESDSSAPADREDDAGPIDSSAHGLSTGEGTSADESDGFVTRMEEHLEVGVEQVATERVKLRKHVVTQQETVTVTIRREELRIERVPVSADEASLDPGDGIDDSVTEIVLYEERPVVTTVARPVERIRLTKEVVTEEQTVTGDVRKERVAVDEDTVE